MTNSKTLLAGAAALAALLLPAAAHADGWYATARVGAVTDASADYSGYTIDLNGDETFGVAAGTALGPVRVEASYDRQNFNLLGLVSANADLYSLNGYLDLSVTDRFGVFGGAGISLADVDLSYGLGSANAQGTGWNVAGGATYRLAPNLTAEFMVRRTDIDLDDDLTAVSYTSTVGVRAAL